MNGVPSTTRHLFEATSILIRGQVVRENSYSTELMEKVSKLSKAELSVLTLLRALQLRTDFLRFRSISHMISQATRRLATPICYRKPFSRITLAKQYLTLHQHNASQS